MRASTESGSTRLDRRANMASSPIASTFSVAKIERRMEGATVKPANPAVAEGRSG